jgi:6-phosphogluconolactonase
MTLITNNIGRICTVALALYCAAGAFAAAADAPGREYFVYFGSYTEFKLPSIDPALESRSKGIYVSRFRPGTGELTAPKLAAEIANPSFLAVNPNQRYLYSVIEDPLGLGNLRDKSSFVRAFAINRATGKLGVLNTVPANGGSTCFVSVDASGKFAMVANYTTGSVSVRRIQEDGSLGEQTSFMQHAAKGTSAPHAHWIGVSPDNRFTVSTDLGTGEVLVYRFDGSKGTLVPNDPPFVSTPEHAGPRHFVFSSDGHFGYALTEMGSTVIAYSWDPVRGILKQFQTVSVAPNGYHGEGHSSELALHPNGRFLYAAQRGSDTITVFSIDAKTGTLTTIQQEPSRGMMPRSFGIDPTGSYLFAANQLTDSVILFRIDAQTGRITPTHTVLRVENPTCVTFAEAPQQPN